MSPLSSLEVLRTKLGLSGLSGLWKVFAIIFALLNLKNLPFAWHIRLLKSLYTHARSSRVRIASKAGAAALFQPLIISSRVSLLECDYNIHKSNSTYFSDFDFGRCDLLISVCGHGIDKLRKELLKEGPESFAVMLGGVSFNFRREIKPFESYEIWTRVLCWDHKWLYVVGHFVKKGAVKPKGYTLQPWKKATDRVSNGEASEDDRSKSGPHPAIFASGISKYVCKKGRRTIPPERVLRASELLPDKPADHITPSSNLTPDPEGTSMNAVTISAADTLTPENAGEILAASLTAKAGSDEWTWERVEAERQRGMKIAEMYNGLDALNDEFTADQRPALGHY